MLQEIKRIGALLYKKYFATLLMDGSEVLNQQNKIRNYFWSNTSMAVIIVSLDKISILKILM